MERPEGVFYNQKMMLSSIFQEHNERTMIYIKLFTYINKNGLKIIIKRTLNEYLK